jgi:CMP-N,N'-diacetyllegionaminic acid synthase
MEFKVINGERCLGIILARGGSIRLPNKNIKLLAGKPLIQWTIEAGLESKAIDHLIVSTDDLKIAEIASSLGAEVPFIRPAAIATDSSNSYDVLKHAYKALEKQEDSYSYIVMLQPTSPLRTFIHIDEAAKLLENKNADGILGVSELMHPQEWNIALPQSLEMMEFDNFDKNLNSQLFETRYSLNGAIYITSIDRMEKENSHIYGSSMYAYIMNQEDSIDIDNAYDFEVAQYFISKRFRNK